jgi:glycosyltransferase involved in cell wall biosynthesis
MKTSYPPKLVLLSTASSIGGMERIVCGLSREFTSRNWDVRTIFPKSERDKALLNWSRYQGVEVETNPSLIDAADTHTWNDMSKLRGLIFNANPDVVNIHYGDNFISLKDIIALRSSGSRRIIVTVHGASPWKSGNTKKRLMTFISGFLVDKVVTVSKATQKVLRQSGIPDSKLTIIPNGLRKPPQMTSIDQSRDQFHFPQGKLIIGTLSRLVPHKGAADLIKAMSLLNSVHKNLFMVVAGDGTDREYLECLANDLIPGRYKFLGSIMDVDQFMSAIDIFVLPSYMEGFGLVFIEAAFHGIPSIGTCVGGIPDAIIADKTGLLVPPGDHYSLSKAIDRLASDELFRKQLGYTARQRALSDFTEEKMADRYEKLFLC